MIHLFKATGLNACVSEVKFYAHLRPVSLLSAARPGTYLRYFFEDLFFLAFSFVKQIHRARNYLKYRREHVFPDCDSFCPPF